MSRRLSDYEKRRILLIAADGMTPAQVADVMNRQPDTVKRFLAREKAHDANESAQEQS